MSRTDDAVRKPRHRAAGHRAPRARAGVFLRARRGGSIAASIVAAALVLSSLTILSPAALSPAHAAGTPTPFTCTVPTVFDANGSTNTVLDAQYQNVAGSSFVPVGAPSTWQYNSIAYNTSNNLIYATSQTGSANGNPGDELLIVDSTGAVFDQGPITGLPAADKGFLNIGFFDGAGNYWTANSAGDGILYKVALTSPHTATPLANQSAAIPNTVNDFTFAQGFAWGTNGSSIYRINLSTGNVTVFAVTLPQGAGTYGAAWTYGNGNLGFDNNAGGVTQIAVANAASSSPTFTIISTGPGPASYNNDGTACSEPASMTVAKSASTALDPTGALVSAGGTVTWTLTLTNSGPGYSSGFVANDPVPAGYSNVQVTGSTVPGAAAGNGYGCAVTANAVHCVEGFGSAGLAPGASVTITLTATGPASGCLSNVATVLGNEQANGTQSSNTSTTCVPAQSVQVDKTWLIKNPSGATVGTYNLPSQPTDTASTLPAGFSAAPTLTGQASPSFGTTYSGYAVGQTVSVGEGTVTVPTGCTVTSQQLTAVDGTKLVTPASLPYSAALTTTPSPNTFTITNTITCTQTLTLVKTVAFGSLPATDWTLTGTGPSGSLTGPNGVTGSPGATTVSVTPQVAYALSETSTIAGTQNYIPTSAGWVCTAGSTSVPVSNASVVVGYGQAVTCTITNTTAKITVLKHIQGSGGLAANEFTIAIAPSSGSGTATFPGSETASGANTVEVKPGASYTVTEQSLSSSTAYLSLGLQQSTDGGATWTTLSSNQISASAGTQALYRFVNESVPAIALPLTGGLGTDVITYWAISLLGAVAVLLGWQLRRRIRVRRQP